MRWVAHARALSLDGALDVRSGPRRKGALGLSAVARANAAQFNPIQAPAAGLRAVCAPVRRGEQAGSFDRLLKKELSDALTLW
jgi:hypothetical protein